MTAAIPVVAAEVVSVAAPAEVVVGVFCHGGLR